MGRPKGHRLSQETKNRIAASQSQNWEIGSRRAFVDFNNRINAAVRAGDAETAYAIIDRFMAGMPQSEKVS